LVSRVPHNIFSGNTLGIGIVRGDKVLANINNMYRPEEGGIHPRQAMDHHINVAKKLLQDVLEEAKISINDIDLIAFSKGPGLPQCLRVGSVIARTLSLKLNKPLIPVNHCIAHIEIGKLLTGSSDPVTLYVSGGNTQIIAYTEKRYRVFGETQDLPIGNALDMFARHAGFPHPGAPEIEKLALKGKYIKMPYVVKGMDVSFSGIITHAIKLMKDHKLENICYSLQETCFAMLTEVTERAMAHTNKNEVLLTGGVAANKRLTSMLDTMCKQRNAKLYVCPMKYSGDNGAMIAWTGLLQYKNGYKTTLDNTKIDRYWRTEDVEINWL